jgi:uncharacterized membrane protein YgcG
MEDVDLLFGRDDVVLTKFTDDAGVLRVKERVEIRQEMERFEKKFPQLFFSIYVSAFDEVPNLRQFGFWLLNRAAYEDVGLDRPNECGILLMVDVNGKATSMSYGYAIMPYLNEDNTFEILSAAHPFLLQSNYLKAFKTIISRTELVLKKGWRRVKKNPESLLAASGQAPKKVDNFLKRIREGNREAGKGSEEVIKR